MKGSRFKITLDSQLNVVVTRTDDIALEDYIAFVHSKPWLLLQARSAIQVSQIKLIEKLS